MVLRRVEKTRLDMGGLPKAGVLSLFLHIALAAIFMLTLGPPGKKGKDVYRVTLRPFSPPEGIQSVNPGGGPAGPSPLRPSEPIKRDGSVKGTHTKEMLTPVKAVEKPEKKQIPQSAKKEMLAERPAKEASIKLPSEKAEAPKKETAASLQRAIEDIHKKVALDNIQKKVAGRDRLKGEKTEGPSSTGQSTEPLSLSGYSKDPTGSSSRTRTGTEGNLETGTGSGSGYGPGTGGYPIGGVPWGSPQGSPGSHTKLDDYYSLIWAQIKKEWALPENLREGKANLEATVVIVIEKDGKLQKCWLEKRSGNAIYDQRALRAIAKAGSFPPIPKEFGENTIEVAICFHPD